MVMRRIYAAYAIVWLSVASLVTLVVTEVESRPLQHSCNISEDN